MARTWRTLRCCYRRWRRMVRQIFMPKLGPRLHSCESACPRQHFMRRYTLRFEAAVETGSLILKRISRTVAKRRISRTVCRRSNNLVQPVNQSRGVYGIIGNTWLRHPNCTQRRRCVEFAAELGLARIPIAGLSELQRYATARNPHILKPSTYS